MTDKNGITIEKDQYIQIIRANVKNDNGIYIVESYYAAGNSFCLKKVKQDGTKSVTKYNIFFLDKNSISRNPDMIFTVITKDQLKQAAQEVTAYIKGETAKTKVYSFVKTESQEVKTGFYIHFKKPVLLVGHINTIGGKYLIEDVSKDGRVSLYLIGKKGEKVAFNMNGYYQSQPIILSFKADVIKRLFEENYIEVMERKETTIGEKLKMESEQGNKIPKPVEDNKPEQVQRPTEVQIAEPNNTVPSTDERIAEKLQDEAKAISYSVSEDVDTRDGSKIYIVKLSEKVSKEEYQKINAQIKAIGGYYSRFKKGFLFKNDPTEQLKTVFGTAETNTVLNKNDTIDPKEIEPHYYEINEEMAKTSKGFWSMFDYVPNSETNGYKRAVNEVYDTVKQIAEQKPQYLPRALLLADRYAKKYAEWINRGFRIAMMCPSVLISGGSNFPVRKKEKQNRAEDKRMEDYQYIKAIPGQIQNLLSGYHKEVIKSGDSDALEQLKTKLEKLQAEREQIKAENKQLKANGESIHAPYILQNLGQNIRNVEQRIEQLEKTKAKPTSDITEQYNTTVCKVIENTDIMRLQLIFDGKPSDDIRSILKSHGFRWSPYNEAWQRQLTSNAKYETKIVLREIEKLEQEKEQSA